MAVSYDPKDASSVLPAGTYNATFKASEDGTSKKTGNPMETWTFTVYGPGGKETTVTEYVVIPAGVFKIKQLAKALEKEKDFATGQFRAEDYINSDLVVILEVEEGGQYEDKNRIKKFLPATYQPDADSVVGASTPQRQANPGRTSDDGMPGSTTVTRSAPKGLPPRTEKPRGTAADVSDKAEFTTDEVPF